MWLEFKLTNWKFMNFRMKLRENTYIFTIKNILKDKHGRMDDLRVCFESFHESKEVKDDMLTLLDCGCRGELIKKIVDEVNRTVIRDESAIPTYQVFYEFKPAASTVEPILLYFNPTEIVRK